ncbi:MAG: hypothetical protein R2764_25350 [Bacteroidales bacterium]
MKKSLLLLALTFAFVSFLTAQNDCTGSSGNNATLSTEKPALTDAANTLSPKDCSMPTIKIEDLYSADEFKELMMDGIGQPPTKPYENYGHPVPNTQLRTSTSPNGNQARNLFSASGSYVCCVLPPNYERSSPLKDE